MSLQGAANEQRAQPDFFGMRRAYDMHRSSDRAALFRLARKLEMFQIDVKRPNEHMCDAWTDTL